MAEVTDVTIVSGLPTAGDGTVPTLSKTNTVIGAVTETAPASDTASSGLNGRLQRIAQRLTSLIGATLTVTGTVTANAGTGNHAVTAASGSVASGAISSGAVASGAFASGALASGSVASGALASGSIADGASVTIGAKGDSKSNATDGTSITAMSVWKQISASIQAVATAIGTAVITRGAGASDSGTLRVSVDSGQIGALVAGGVPCVSGGYEYETVAVSTSNNVLGAVGATGDYLEGILCVVATAATSEVKIGDGATPAVVILPNAVGAGVGSYYVPLGLVSVTGSWRVTTAAGVTVIATGNFT